MGGGGAAGGVGGALGAAAGDGGTATAETGTSTTAETIGSLGVPGGFHEENCRCIGGPVVPYLLKGYTALQRLKAHVCTLRTSCFPKPPLLQLVIFAHPDVPFTFGVGLVMV